MNWDSAQGLTPGQVLEWLLEGNRRFASGRTQGSHRDPGRRVEVASGQHPAAAILGCVDSRVPPELVFDQGLGDLLVARSAGQTLDSILLGSIEFAALQMNVPLILVLGHSRCGAIKAAMQAQAGGAGEGHLAGLIQALQPAIEAGRNLPGDPVENAVRVNVERIVAQLRRLPSLAELLDRGRLAVEGGIYNLESGEVEILPTL